MSSEEESSMEFIHDQQSLKGCKVKRTRQRVDAGEPRNSYASIANFSSRGGYNSHSYHFNGLNLSPPNKLIGDIISKSSADNNIKSDMIVLDDPMMQLCVNGNIGGQIAPFINGGGNGITTASQNSGSNGTGHHYSSDIDFNCNKSATFLPSKSLVSSDASATAGAHLLRDILQTGRKFDHSIVDSDQQNASGSNKVGPSQCSDASELDDDEEEDLAEGSRDAAGMEHIASSAGDEGSPLGIDEKPSSRSPSPESGEQNRPNTNSNSNSSAIADVKRARVENIVSNMLLGGNGGPNSSGGGKSADATPASVNGCKKRKLYQPQQSKLNGPADNENEEEFEEIDDMPEVCDEDIPEDDDDTVSELDLSAKKAKTEDRDNLRRQLEDMQSQLMAMRQRYVLLFEAQQHANGGSRLNSLSNIASPVNLTTSVSPADECDTEMEDIASDKGDATPISQLSEMTNRDTPAAISSNVPTAAAAASIINDPAHFLDEARRLINEQEKMTHKSSDRQSCIVRPVTSGASGSIGIPGQLSLQPSLSDMEWFIEALKGDLLQAVDATFAKFLQHRRTSQKHLNFDQSEPSKDLTLLSQMLDRKSPRSKVIDRGAVVSAATITSPIKGNMNGHSSRGSPFSLPTEMAPAPKPTPFPFPPPNFKSPFFIPSVAPPGAQMPHQPALIPTSALAQHFNSIASTLNQVNHQRGEQSLANNYNSNNSSREYMREHIREHTRENNSNGHVSSGHVFHRSDDPLPEQTEAMALVVAPKRKRHKVTDTRITPRTVSRLLGQEPLISCGSNRDASSVSPPGSVNYHHGPPPPPPPLVPVSLPTSVAIPNPSLHQSEIFSGATFPFGDHPRLSLFGDMHEENDLTRDSKGHNTHAAIAASAVAHAAAAHHLHMLAASRASPDSLHGYPGSGLHYGRVGSDNGADGSETNETQMYDPTMPMTSTLTPMHLRKAKLMFFFVRYPSSAILKMFFPDIKFNKNNTAQLVKWFSNFREFYYIQMEKYARQALSEGVKNAEELRVSSDAELLRVLNLHYNRNNHIDVPENFRYVSEQTLREFFKAVQSGKDTEQSWKKAIYKIIARLDDNVPEYFKSPNFLEQLE